MNATDVFMLTNLGLTLIPLIFSVLLFVLLKAEISGWAIIFSFIHLALGVCSFNANLANSFIFGIIAGTLIQPFLADIFITKKTLIYGGDSRRIARTPWWMAMLWGVALTQLSYLWFRLDSLIADMALKYSIFLLIGFLYFLIFEFTVNNYTSWWIRKNCWQILNVAVYALLAETLTVGILPLILSHANSKQESVAMGMVGGILIAAIFVASCVIFYKKEEYQ